jgi:catechol 2,3-dioxygenase-like lactoylglutathione lyase family enzyme
MVGYTTHGTNDLDRAIAFYDALLDELGGKQILNDGRLVVWAGGNGGMLGICKPYDGEPAGVGNGTMVALAAGSKEGVRKLHEKALALGASDEGAPGPRIDNFYGGYFRDLDGNNLVAFHIGA